MRSGGVLIAIRKELPSSLLLSEASFFEQVFVKIKFKEHNVLLSSAYFIPNSPSTCYEEHVNTLDRILPTHDFSNFLILGDYNLPGYTWPSGSCLIADGR